MLKRKALVLTFGLSHTDPQVERMQSSIGKWRLKILQHKKECEERNSHLRAEKENLGKHFQELKGI